LALTPIENDEPGVSCLYDCELMTLSVMVKFKNLIIRELDILNWL